MLKYYHFILIALFISATTALSAQITLTAENYGVQDSVILNDTLYFEGAYLPDIPSGGENQIWDYSAVQADSFRLILSLPVPEEDTCFAGAQSLRSLTFFFQAFQYLGFGYTAYEESGRFEVGRKTDGAMFPLTAITGNMTDTLAILPRIDSTRQTLISFPATYGTISQDSFVQVANLELTVGAFGLNRTPAAQYLATQRTLEVIGYGDLILPSLSGVPSEPLEALLIKTTIVEEYTYTLAGGPAPAALLQAFGVSQNDVTTSVEYYFHVEGVGRSAASILIPSGRSDYQFRFRRVSPGLTSGVSNVNKPESLSFFPNPVRPGEALYLTAPADATGGMVRLLDLQGRTITENAFSTLSGDKIEVLVPATVKPGLYFQQVVNERGQLVGVGKVLVQ